MATLKGAAVFEIREMLLNRNWECDVGRGDDEREGWRR